MQRPWRLTRQAEASLLEIALWTIETFGSRQAAAYEDDLIAKCQDIASSIAVSQGCRQLISPDLAEDLRFARSGQHFIVFIEDAEQVIIVNSCIAGPIYPANSHPSLRAGPENPARQSLHR